MHTRNVGTAKRCASLSGWPYMGPAHRVSSVFRKIFSNTGKALYGEGLSLCPEASMLRHEGLVLAGPSGGWGGPSRNSRRSAVELGADAIKEVLQTCTPGVFVPPQSCHFWP
jgi:hypothetical protein